jgi:hypothetical protein
VLDLHTARGGVTQPQALRLLEEAVRRAYEEGVRSLLVIHGQGRHGEGGGILRAAVRARLAQWTAEGSRYLHGFVPGEEDAEQQWNAGTTVVRLRDVGKERLLRVLKTFHLGGRRYEKGRNLPEDLFASPEEIQDAIRLGFVRRRSP